MLRIASYKVNGIRAAQRRRFGAWLQRQQPEVIAIQEMRCPPVLVPGGDFDVVDYGV